MQYQNNATYLHITRIDGVMVSCIVNEYFYMRIEFKEYLFFIGKFKEHLPQIEISL